MGYESYLKIPKIFQNTKIQKKNNTVQNDSQKKEPNKIGKTTMKTEQIFGMTQNEHTMNNGLNINQNQAAAGTCKIRPCSPFGDFIFLTCSKC